jgi:hypothetical protein
VRPPQPEACQPHIGSKILKGGPVKLHGLGTELGKVSFDSVKAL